MDKKTTQPESTITELIQQAQQLQQQGSLQQAEKIYQEVLKQHPQQSDCIHYLGILLTKRGQDARGLALIQQSIELAPTYHNYRLNLGLFYESRNNKQLALKTYIAALATTPSLSNKPLQLLMQQLQEEDIKSVFNTLSLNNNFNIILARTYFVLGEILLDKNHNEQAISAFQHAISFNKNLIKAHIYLGNLYLKTQKLDQAITTYKYVLHINPKLVDTYGHLAVAYEQLGNFQLAQQVVSKGLTLQPDHAFLLLNAARCAEHAGDFKPALQFINKIKEDQLPSDTLAMKKFVEGRILDHLNKANDAFAAFSAANVITQQNLHIQDATQNEYMLHIDKLLESLTSGWLTQMKPTSSKNNQSPVFLLGFPRSATTLIDTILRGHTRIQVMEEKPCINAVIDSLTKDSINYPQDLASLSNTKIKTLTEKYFQEVNNSIDRIENCLLVDKLPLNTVCIPMIYRLFPNAKIIFAVRHPNDVCLSCFMQLFTINSAMANFLNLSSTVELYCKVMTLWQTYEKNFSLKVMYVHYDKLLKDLEQQALKITDFLELDWQPSMLNYISSSKQQFINTPSYHQVIRPIFQDAQNRWLKYKKQLKPYQQQLKPFIKYFGY